MIGVTKKQIRTTLVTIGGTSRESRRDDAEQRDGPKAVQAEESKTRQGEQAGPARPDSEDGRHVDEDQGIVEEDQEVAPEHAVHVDRQRQPHLLIMPSASMNTLHPSFAVLEISVHTMKPSARCGTKTATSTLISMP